MSAYEEALNMYQCSLRYQERSFSDDYPALAHIMKKAGTVFAALGSYDEAMELAGIS